MTALTRLPNPGTYDVATPGHWPSAFAVDHLAVASLAAVGQQLARWKAITRLAAHAERTTINARLAALWFKYSFRPQGWEMPSLWDDIAGVYETQDGWIRLHTNLPHHKAAALGVLGCAGSRDAVTQAVAQHTGDALETAIVAAGGVAAFMRSRAQWQTHPQGRALASEPLIDWFARRSVTTPDLSHITAARPLKGLRVLDLTRVLAGPVATRTLAGLGAEVLRIDPTGWDEPGVLQDIALGKSMATLDLKATDGVAMLKSLLARADILVHGYRPGALDALGLDLATRDAIAPNRIEVSLNAYGWTGPWATRRGFDSLVQMSCGIADTGRNWADSTGPTPLPVQALDHATGYLMAAAVLSALADAASGAPIALARLSLARTAEALFDLQPLAPSPEITTDKTTDYTPMPEHSGWGEGLRLLSPLCVGETALHWDSPAQKSGTAPPRWRDDA